MLVERIAPQSEVIRAIVSGFSPCLWGGARTGDGGDNRQLEALDLSLEDRLVKVVIVHRVVVEA